MPPLLDDKLFRLIYARGQYPVLSVLAAALSALGQGQCLLAALPLFLLRKTRRLAAWLAGTLVVTGIAVFGLKALVRRGRPFTAYTGEDRILLDSPTDYSFPSGHAAASFAVALFVAHVLLAKRPFTPHRRFFASASIALAASIALSRIVLGFHYPLDVAAGALIGGGLGAIGSRAYLRSKGLEATAYKEKG